jgi:hypothetical protein
VVLAAVASKEIYHTSRHLLRLGHISEAKVCHALMVGFGLFGGLAGAGKAAVGSGGLKRTALSTVVQGSPGRSGRHGEYCDWESIGGS